MWHCLSVQLQIFCVFFQDQLQYAESILKSLWFFTSGNLKFRTFFDNHCMQVWQMCFGFWPKEGDHTVRDIISWWSCIQFTNFSFIITLEVLAVNWFGETFRVAIRLVDANFVCLSIDFITLSYSRLLNCWKFGIRGHNIEIFLNVWLCLHLYLLETRTEKALWCKPYLHSGGVLEDKAGAFNWTTTNFSLWMSHAPVHRSFQIWFQMFGEVNLWPFHYRESKSSFQLRYSATGLHVNVCFTNVFVSGAA